MGMVNNTDFETYGKQVEEKKTETAPETEEKTEEKAE